MPKIEVISKKKGFHFESDINFPNSCRKSRRSLKNENSSLFSSHKFAPFKPKITVICKKVFSLNRGGYSNLRARGKNFQKLMLSKKKSFDLGLHIFLRNSWCSLKKKRSLLRIVFHTLNQRWANYGPRAKCGPPNVFCGPRPALVHKAHF